MNLNKLTTKEKLQKLAPVIRELEWKVEHFGEMYGRTKDDAWYQKRKYAREGLTMAKKEWSKLERKYRKERGIVWS